MDYIPPQAVEVEKRLLGSIIIDEEDRNKVLLMLSCDDFYHPQHNDIYKTILELMQENQPVDVITISDRLKNLDYLVEITGLVTITGNTVNYAKIIKGKAIRRKYAMAAMYVIEKAVNGIYDNIIDFKNDVIKEFDIDCTAIKPDITDIKNISIDMLTEIDRRYQKLDDNNKKYGFTWIDRHTQGLHDADLTILSARPSIGKTAFAMQLAINLSENCSNILIFSLEMCKKQLMDRFISNISGVELTKVRTGQLNETEWVKINKGISLLSTFEINIFDNVYKVEDIIFCCRQQKNSKQLNCIIVDYLQLSDTLKKTNTANEKTAHITRQFKLLAKEMNCPVILLSQLSRAGEAEKRRPKLTDLRDSGAIEQDADNVFFLHDPNYGNYQTEDTAWMSIIEFVIGKQRQGTRDIYNEVGFIKSLQRFVSITK